MSPNVMWSTVRLLSFIITIFGRQEGYPWDTRVNTTAKGERILGHSQETTLTYLDLLQSISCL